MTDNERSPDERSDIREWPILGNHRRRVAQGCPGKIFAGRAAFFLPLPARGCRMHTSLAEISGG
jgi:hypothetical protein